MFVYIYKYMGPKSLLQNKKSIIFTFISYLRYAPNILEAISNFLQYLEKTRIKNL